MDWRREHRGGQNRTAVRIEKNRGKRVGKQGNHDKPWRCLAFSSSGVEKGLYIIMMVMSEVVQQVFAVVQARVLLRQNKNRSRETKRNKRNISALFLILVFMSRDSELFIH